MPINYNKYPPNWQDLRSQVLKREGNKCKFCGLENHTNVWRIIFDKKSYWFKSMWPVMELIEYFGSTKFHHDVSRIKVILTIAHLDHDEDNHNVDISRLVALCQRCHLKYDAPEKARRRTLKK